MAVHSNKLFYTWWYSLNNFTIRLQDFETINSRVNNWEGSVHNTKFFR